MQAQAPNQEATARNRRLVDDVYEMAGHSALEAMPDGICTRPSTQQKDPATTISLRLIAPFIWLNII
jgi:hypothetical protein